MTDPDKKSSSKQKSDAPTGSIVNDEVAELANSLQKLQSKYSDEDIINYIKTHPSTKHQSLPLSATAKKERKNDADRITIRQFYSANSVHFDINGIMTASGIKTKATIENYLDGKTKTPTSATHDGMKKWYNGVCGNFQNDKTWNKIE